MESILNNMLIFSLIMGTLIIVTTIMSGISIYKAFKIWDEERKKPKEIIITIRNEADKDKIIEEIIKAEINKK